MVTDQEEKVALFADKSTQQWVVRDSKGQYWFLPPVDQAWKHRAPFTPTEDSDLQLVPGHYLHLMGCRP